MSTYCSKSTWIRRSRNASSPTDRNFDDRLRQERIRHRVELANDVVTVRLANAEDFTPARELVRAADQQLVITDGTDGKSFTVRMSEDQIRERQNFAIEQNMTTLRNRVDQLGVAEPLVQRQGVDRIVVQLPGVQNPTKSTRFSRRPRPSSFDSSMNRATRRARASIPGRGEEAGQYLKREVIASGDEIVNASAGFSNEGQPAVDITLDSAGGERMLATTRENLNKPMSTVFIEWEEKTVERGGETVTIREKTEEIINTATIRGVFKNRFQITGVSQGEASGSPSCCGRARSRHPYTRSTIVRSVRRSARTTSIAASGRFRSVSSP